MIGACPLCGADAVEQLLRAPSPVFMMVRSGAVPSADAFAELAVVQCRDCGHFFNRNFSDDLAARLYGDVPLTNVPVHPTMIGRLTALRDWLSDIIDGRHVLEIGGGSGHLARVLSQKAAEVILYEPCLALGKDLVPESNIRLVSATYPQARLEQADVVICRQVIEHVADPLGLLRAIRDTLPAGGYAYLEVPDAGYISTHAALPDLHLQHVQYFSREGFGRLVQRAGLVPLRTIDLMNGHDFGVLCRAGRPSEEGAAKGTATPGLATRLSRRREQARQTAARMPRPIALYGASPHSQVFLNHLDGAVTVDAVLDDNPRSQGWHLYNRDQAVPVIHTPAADLAAYASILIGAYLHDGAIADRLAEAGATARLYTIHPDVTRAGDPRLTSVYQ